MHHPGAKHGFFPVFMGSLLTLFIVWTSVSIVKRFVEGTAPPPVISFGKFTGRTILSIEQGPYNLIKITTTDGKSLVVRSSKALYVEEKGVLVEAESP